MYENTPDFGSSDGDAGHEDAFEAVKLINPKRVVPDHYNTRPPIEQDPTSWADRVRAETSSEPIVVDPGGKVTL